MSELILPGGPDDGAGLRDHIVRAATLSSLLIVLMQMTSAICSLTDCNGSQMFLSFGMIVVAAWLYGFRIPLYLLPAFIFEFAFQGLSAPHALDTALAHVAIASVTAPFAFRTMTWAGIDISVDLSGTVRVWRIIVLAGIKASVFALILQGGLHDLGGSFPLQLHTAYPKVLGDMAGLVIFMIGLMFVFRLADRRR